MKVTLEKLGELEEQETEKLVADTDGPKGDRKGEERGKLSDDTANSAPTKQGMGIHNENSYRTRWEIWYSTVLLYVQYPFQNVFRDMIL